MLLQRKIKMDCDGDKRQKFDKDSKEDLYAVLENINTADDFGKLMRGLYRAYYKHPDWISRKEPGTFLADVGSVASEIENIARDEDLEMPGPIDWQWVSLIVMRAMYR